MLGPLFQLEIKQAVQLVTLKILKFCEIKYKIFILLITRHQINKFYRFVKSQ